MSDVAPTLRIIDSSQLSVSARADFGPTPVVIYIQRNAIDDRFHLTESTTELRRAIVSENLPVLTTVAKRRYDDRRYSTGTRSGSTFFQIVLGLADLEGVELVLPDVKN